MPSNIMRKPRISSASRRFFNPSIRLQARAVQNLNPMEKTQQDIEYEWFTENYAEVSRKHPRRFVVIKDGNFRKCSLYTNDTPGYATGTTWPGQEPEHLKKEPSIGRTDR